MRPKLGICCHHLWQGHLKNLILYICPIPFNTTDVLSVYTLFSLSRETEDMFDLYIVNSIYAEYYCKKVGGVNKLYNVGAVNDG